MNRRRLIVTLPALALTPIACAQQPQPAQAQSQAQPAPDPENTLVMDIKYGQVIIQMYPDLAPKHVERLKVLSRQGFYDGTPFHRVIEGFMAQGGDPTGTGTGGSSLPNLPAEFNRRRFLRGACGMARTQDPNSANSQFFIMFAPAPNLDGQYTLWGQVIRGMEFVDQIKRGAGANGMVTNPDRLLKMRVQADIR